MYNQPDIIAKLTIIIILVCNGMVLCHPEGVYLAMIPFITLLQYSSNKYIEICFVDFIILPTVYYQRFFKG